MKNILVTGAKGQLGFDVVKELNKRGYYPIGIDRDKMDLVNNEEVQRVLTELNPKAIIHCGAYTAVDKAEEESGTCFQINAEATKVIAEYAKQQNIKLIYISTDYVFDGTKVGEYVETDSPNPVNVYGASKLKGEQYVQQLLEKYFIIRISWVFGINGENFIKSIIRLSESRDKLHIISDQIGSPTATADLAPLLITMLETEKYGIYHVTNEGFCSWFEFAQEIFLRNKIEIQAYPIDSSMYPVKAKRPMNSKMSKNKLVKSGFSKLPTWKESLKNYCKELLKI